MQRGDMGRSAQDRGICPGIFGLRHFLIGCDQEVPEKLPCPFPSLLFPTLDSLNDGNKMSRNQRLTCSCWTMRYLSARVEGEQLILFKARDVSLTRRDGRSDVVTGPPEPGWWESDWWLLCRDGSLGPRRRPQRAGWARARPDPGSRLASGDDRSRMAMLVFRLSVACLHHAVSRVLAWYLPTEYCVDSGGTEVQKPREIGQAFCGGTGEKTETLDRLAVVVHQMLAACASQVISSDGRHGNAGVQGCRYEQVGGGWMDSEERGVGGWPPCRQRGLGAGWSQ